MVEQPEQDPEHQFRYDQEERDDQNELLPPVAHPLMVLATADEAVAAGRNGLLDPLHERLVHTFHLPSVSERASRGGGRIRDESRTRRPPFQ